MTLLLPFSWDSSSSKIFLLLKTLDGPKPAASPSPPGPSRCGTSSSPPPSPPPRLPTRARQLTAQQDAVGVLLARHPAQRVAQRPPAAGAQKHQRPVLLLGGFRSLLAPRRLCTGHRRVRAHGVPHVCPLLQQLVTVRVFREPPAQQRGVAPLALVTATRTACRRASLATTGRPNARHSSKSPASRSATGNARLRLRGAGQGGGGQTGVGP